LESECEEAQVRLALGDAAPLYRDAPEATAAREGSSTVIRAFMNEALPSTEPAMRLLAADLVETTLTKVGSSFSATERSPAEITLYADAMADMFCAYVARLAPS
jgi:hypothetical protein